MLDPWSAFLGTSSSRRMHMVRKLTQQLDAYYTCPKVQSRTLARFSSPISVHLAVMGYPG